MRSEGYHTWLPIRLSVRLSISYHVFYHYIRSYHVFYHYIRNEETFNREGFFVAMASFQEG